MDLSSGQKQAQAPSYKTDIVGGDKLATGAAPLLPRSGSEVTVAVQADRGSADAEPPSERPSASLGNKYTIFSPAQKKAIVFGAAAGAILSPLSGQIYFPALPALSRDLNVSINQINLTVTTYMIVQGVAPMFVGSFADTAGRRPAYILCFVVYIAACIGCALAPNYAALLVLRALQSAGSSATISLCQAVVSDIVTAAERGSYVGFTFLPNVLGPTLGPVIGGVISQYLSWRWIFWVLAILAGVTLVGFLFFMPETCRLIVGDGSIRPHPFYRTFLQLSQDAYNRRKRGDSNPISPDGGNMASLPDSKALKMKRPNLAKTLHIFFEREMFVLLMYSGLIYASFFAIATAIPSQFASRYGFDGLRVGLVYVPFGVGSIVAVVFVGKLSNMNYQRHCKRLGIVYDRTREQSMADFPIEKVRLEVCAPFVALFSLILIGWGWALQYHAHLAVELVLLFLAGITLTGFSNPLATLIVDLNPRTAGAASAANNVTRSLLGAATTAFINPLLTAVGAGWGFTILAFANIVFFPAVWLVMKNGVRWRQEKLARKRERQRKRQQTQATAAAEDSVSASTSQEDVKVTIPDAAVLFAGKDAEKAAELAIRPISPSR
ncbi:major facilitator superfamily domain-containing protein [Xylariaceae sp. FL0594]|nr:major facilitator superfamily domain-containing protein [Xylariaceae sp. FL0594]